MKLHVAGFCSSWMSYTEKDTGRSLARHLAGEHALGGGGRRGSVHRPHASPLGLPGRVRRESGAGGDPGATARSSSPAIATCSAGKRRSRPGGGVLELAAGCCYGGSEYRNAYQLLEIDPAAGQVRVYLRVWDGRIWIADRNAYGGAAPEGIAEFQLPRARGSGARSRRAALQRLAVSVSVNTGGGAYVARQRELGRDFVGRDRMSRLTWAPISTGPARAAPRRLLPLPRRRVPAPAPRGDRHPVRSYGQRVHDPAARHLRRPRRGSTRGPRERRRGTRLGPPPLAAGRGGAPSGPRPPWPRPRAPAPCCSGTPARANRRS